MEITPHEFELLVEFREKIKDLKLTGWQLENVELLRWIRARNHNLDNAESMLRKHIIYRKQNNVDELQNWNPPLDFIDAFSYEIWKFDNEGHPVGIGNFGSWNVKDTIFDKGRGKELLTYINYIVEKLRVVMLLNRQKTGSNVNQIRLVLDCKNFNYWQYTSFTAMQFVQEFLFTYEANFPEILRECLIINAPRLFSLFFTTVKQFLDIGTISKIKVFQTGDESWREDFYKSISIDNVSINYGGTSTQILNNFAKVVKKDRIVFPEIPNYETLFKNYEKENFSSALIKSRNDFHVKVNVNDSNSRILYKFESENCKIGFAIYFEGKKALVKIPDAYSHIIPFFGYINCKQPGEYKMTFTNHLSKDICINYSYMICKNSENVICT